MLFTYNREWCFDAFTGKINVPNYVYIMLQITPEETHYSMYTTANDRLDTSLTPGFHYVSMGSTTFENFITAREMMAIFSMSFNHEDWPGPDVIPERKDMLIDWFGYSTNTDLTIYQYVGDIKAMQNQGVTRLNTTGLALGDGYITAPVQPEGECAYTEQSRPCDRCTNWTTIPLLPSRFKLELREHEGSMYLTPQYIVNNIYGLRGGRWAFKWELEGEWEVEPCLQGVGCPPSLYFERDGFNLALPPSLLNNIAYYQIEVTGTTLANMEAGGPGDGFPFEACMRYGPDATEADSHIRRVYTLFPQEGILVEGRHTQPPQPFAANAIAGVGDVLSLTSFPNPTVGTVNVEVETSGPAVFDVKVFDVLGRVVVQRRVEVRAAGVREVDVDMSGLASGTYILVAETESSRVHSRLSVFR